jgi:hypothetical protein
LNAIFIRLAKRCPTLGKHDPKLASVKALKKYFDEILPTFVARAIA